MGSNSSEMRLRLRRFCQRHSLRRPPLRRPRSLRTGGAWISETPVPLVPASESFVQAGDEESLLSLERPQTLGSTEAEVTPWNWDTGEESEIFVPTEKATVLQGAEELTETDILRADLAEAAANIDLASLEDPWTSLRDSPAVRAYAKIACAAPSTIGGMIDDRTLTVSEMTGALPWHLLHDGASLEEVITFVLSDECQYTLNVHNVQHGFPERLGSTEAEDSDEELFVENPLLPPFEPDEADAEMPQAQAPHSRLAAIPEAEEEEEVEEAPRPSSVGPAAARPSSVTPRPSSASPRPPVPIFTGSSSPVRPVPTAKPTSASPVAERLPSRPPVGEAPAVSRGRPERSLDEMRGVRQRTESPQAGNRRGRSATQSRGRSRPPDPRASEELARDELPAVDLPNVLGSTAATGVTGAHPSIIGVLHAWPATAVERGRATDASRAYNVRALSADECIRVARMLEDEQAQRSTRKGDTIRTVLASGLPPMPVPPAVAPPLSWYSKAGCLKDGTFDDPDFIGMDRGAGHRV